MSRIIAGTGLIAWFAFLFMGARAITHAEFIIVTLLVLIWLDGSK